MTMITIIMASYNAASTLEAAADSVLAQTLDDIELIIVDDASSDETLNIARKIAARDKRVTVLAQSINKGPAASRNAALSIAKGEWMAVVDADDVILPKRLEAMIMEARIWQADIVFDNLIYVEGHSERLYLPPHLKLAGALTLETYIESHRRTCAIPNMGFLKPLIRRDVLCRSGVFYDESLTIGEDAMLIMTLMAKGAKACLADGAWYRYFRHGGSISARQGLDSVRTINAAFRHFLKKHDLDGAARIAMLRLATDNDRRILAVHLVCGMMRGHILSIIREIVKTPVMARFLWSELCSQARHTLKNMA